MSKNIDQPYDIDERRHRENLWFSAYTGQMSLLWQQVTYVQLTAVGSIAGWYVASGAGHVDLACFALLIGGIVQSALILLIRRHAQILDEFSDCLGAAGLLGMDSNLAPLFKFSAHAIARLIAAFFITVGLAGIFFTARFDGQHHGSELCVAIAAIATMWIFAKWRYIKWILVEEKWLVKAE